MPVALLLALMTAPADAGVFQRKTMHGDWPDTQVEREFVLPRGWFELQVDVDNKASTGMRNRNGALLPFRNDATLHHSELVFNFDHGFSDRVKLHLEVPIVRASLANNLGANVATMARGDVHTSVTWQPWFNRVLAGAFELDLKSPSGVEWPGGYLDGPGNFSSFLTGTGTNNLGGTLYTKYRLGDAASVGVAGSYVYKFPGIVGYVIELDGFGNGWINPGNEIRTDVDATVQIGSDFALSGVWTWSHRGQYVIASSGKGNRVQWDQGSVVQRPGAFQDLGAQISMEPAPAMEVALRVSGQIKGSDTRTFGHLGLEEFSPQPGLTMGFSGTVRW